MATEYLIRGATTLGASAWSGSGFADGNDYVIAEDFGVIVDSSLDQSSLTTGIESLWIKPTCTAGRIGGGSAGSLLIDVDNSSDAFVSNQGMVDLYLAAAGGSGKIERLDQSGPGNTYLTAGTVDEVTISAGRLTVNGSTVVVDLVAVGGASTIEYNATAITSAEFHGGHHIVKRAVTTLRVTGDAVVIYDPDDAATIAGTTIYTNGGTLIHRAGATPTIVNRGGKHDFSQARTSFTPGGTAWTYIGTKFVDSPSVSVANRSPLFGSKVVANGPVPIG